MNINKTRLLYVLIGLLIIILSYFLYYKRTIIQNDKGTFHLTIWKQLGGKCYIIPGKYYSILPPKENYIETGNHAILNVAWNPQEENKSFALTISMSNIQSNKLSKEVLLYEDYNAFIEKFYGKKFETTSRSFSKTDSAEYFKTKYQTVRINIGCLSTRLCKDD